MPSPELSIVTPSYMQVHYLEEAIASVVHQRGVTVEHVVCDGGSTDGTVGLLESSRVRWVSEADSGQSEALNKGFELASGKIVGWLNADDFYLEGALCRVLDYFDSNPEIDVVYGDCVFVDQEGRLLRAKAEHQFRTSILRHYGCYIPSTSTFFRRESIESGLLSIDETLHYVMDYEVFMRLAAGGARFGYLPEFLAAFRWHASNKSLDDERRLRERHEVQDRYGVRPHGRLLRSLTEPGWRALHVIEKLASGGLMRQRKALSERGRDMRWWADSVG